MSILSDELAEDVKESVIETPEKIIPLSNVVIGSGTWDTPEPILRLMERASRALSEKRLIVHNGGQTPADRAFLSNNPDQCVYTPYPDWPSFYQKDKVKFLVESEAQSLKDFKDLYTQIESHYPLSKWEALSCPAQMSYLTQAMMFNDNYRLMVYWHDETKNHVPGNLNCLLNLAPANTVFNLYHREVVEKFCRVCGVRPPNNTEEEKVAETQNV